MKTIYYNVYDSTGFIESSDSLDNSVWFDDRFFPNIKTSYIEENKNVPFYECPAWSHKAKRTFTVKSPIDIELNFDCSYDPPVISSDYSQSYFDSIIGPTSSQSNWYLKNPDRVIIQLSVPLLFCWTDHNNIWVEQKPYQQTIVKNNFSLVGGWYSLSSWTRPLSFALDIYDATKPLIIKKGDPIYQICFYSKNLNDNFKMVKAIPSEKVKNQSNRNVALKYYGKNLAQSHMFSEQKSKCPFSFLRKK